MSMARNGSAQLPYLVRVPTQSTDAEILRGRATRQMIVEDARWAADIVLSAEHAPAVRSHIGLIIGQHFARIAYEGADALRSENPNIGVPALAALLGDRFATITARARHAAKLLDNSSTNYTAAISGIEQALQEHRDRFTGNSHPLFRWLESDFGLYRFKRQPLGATIATAYRLGLDVGDGSISGESLLEVSTEWGETFAALGVANGDLSEFTATLDFRRCPVSSVDRLAERYFRRRFEPSFPMGLKMLLLMIEGDLNTSLTLVPLTARGHEMAAFRVQTVVAYHSLSSLSKILDQSSTLDTPAVRSARALLSEAPTRRLISRAGVKIRDRCIHYPILNPTIVPNFSMPMYGIVEHLAPGLTWASYYADVLAVTRRVAEQMSAWTAPRRSRSRT